MRKITFFFALLVTMITTAFAQDYSAVKVYQITAKDANRGALYATAESTHLTHCGATYSNYHNRDIAVNADDVNQRFAFIEYEGALYLYSLGAEKFASKDGNFAQLTELPKGFVTIEDADGYKQILFNGQNRLNFSGGYDHGAYVNYETPDDGNYLNLTEVGTFDATELVASIVAKIEAEAQALVVARNAFNEAVANAQTILNEAGLTVSTQELPLQVTDANAAYYLWSNAPEPNEGHIKFLLDGSTGTYGGKDFFHTQWSNPVPAAPHYIEVDLGVDNELSEFAFSYSTRNFSGADDYPNVIQITGSNDKQNYNEIYTVSDLPASSNTNWSSNNIVATTAYRYIRFNVTKTQQSNRTYWHMSEFDIYTTNVSVAEKYQAVANEVVALKNACDSHATTDAYDAAMYASAAEAISAAVEAVNAGVVVPELDPLVESKYTRNPAESALSPQNMYQLAGVKLDFPENIKKVDGVTVWGKIVDANGNEVAVLDKIMGGTTWFATPYTSTPVTAAGTYKVVVNAGVFTNVDGTKEYKGGEYEFTVAKKPATLIPSAEDGLFYNASFTSVDEFKTQQIVVSGADEVTVSEEVKITMTSGETVYTATVTVNEMNGNKVINIVFPDEDYAAGKYTINIPAGAFMVDGVANEEYYASSFTYSKPQLKITKDWTSWESLFTEKYMMPREVTIAINNATEVTVAEGLAATLTVGETTYTSTVSFTNEENNYWITFKFAEIQAIYDDENADFVKGEYTFTVPAGLYTVNSEANVEETKTFTYGDAVVEEFTVTSISPAVGNVTELSSIEIAFSNNTKPEQLILTNGDKRFFFIAKNGAYVAVDPLQDYSEITITELGTYTLDLSELEGLTGDKVFTWTVVEPVANTFIPSSYESTNKYVPSTLQGIKIWFDEKVASVELAEGETSFGYILNAAGERVLELDKKSTVNGNLKYVSLTNADYEAVETAGEYTVVVTAVITSESGTVHTYGEFKFTVEKAPVEVSRDVEFWGTVESIPAEINLTINNADAIVLDETKKATLTCGETVYEATATLNDNVITLAFSAEFVEGDYTFVIPAGLYTADGEAGEEVSEEFTFKKPVPLKVIAIEPAAGNVEKIESITIQFNQPVEASYMLEMNGYALVKSGWEATETVTYMIQDANYEETVISTPGEYTINIADVTEMSLAEGETASYTWTIAENTQAPEVTELIDATKEYYLKSSWNYGMNSGYFTLGTKSSSNYGHAYMANDKSQAFKFTLVENGNNKYYTLATEIENVTGGSYSAYVDCSHASNVNSNAMTASNIILELENATSSKYVIKTANGYLTAAMIDFGTDGFAYHVFSNGDRDNALAFSLVEKVTEAPVVAAPAIVEITPANGAEVPSLSEIVLTFDKAIKEIDTMNAIIKVKTSGSTSRAYGYSATLSADGLTVTFPIGDDMGGTKTIDAAGEYTIEIPAGVVTSTDGAKNEAANYAFTIAAPAPEVTELIDATKEYYLKSSWNYGMNSGYFTLGTKSGSNYGHAYMANDKSQAFKFTLVENGNNKYYTLATEIENVTGGSYPAYVDCSHASNVNSNAMTASNIILELENATSSKYVIKTANGYLTAAMIDLGTDGYAYHVFSNGDRENALAFSLVEKVTEAPVVAAPAIVEITPANGAEVPSLSEIVITFDKAIKEIDTMNGIIKVKTSGLTSRAYGYSATLSADGLTVTFPIGDDMGGTKTIDAAGEYTIEIPAGVVTSTDGAKNEAASYAFTIVAPAAVVDYTPTFTGIIERNDRKVTAVTLGDNRYDLPNDAQSSMYVDATETVTFTVVAGETVKANVEHMGEWVHHALYIDFDSDGFTSGIEEGSDWKPAGDLVSYSFYNNNGSNDEQGYNSVGTYMSGMDRHMPEMPEFVAPATPGIYRMRFVQCWCSIDPNGDNDGKFGDFKGNGDQIIDVMLEVVEGTTDGIEEVDAETEMVIYDLTGRRITEIVKPGIYIVNGKKILVK